MHICKILLKTYTLLKLSNNEYFLRKILALEPRNILESGTTLPQIISGVCTTTGEKNEYVVKFIKAQRMSAESSCRELLAALIAKELDFNIPEPVIINITNEFVELMRGNENFKVASNSLGYNFGNEYQVGYSAVGLTQTLDTNLTTKLVELFALDMVIGNADRRVEKPNFLSNGTDLLVFDHELAFGFASDLFKNPTPWLIRDQDMTWINQNFCFQKLKGHSYDFTNFISKLNVLNEDFWHKFETIAPAEWLTEQWGIIKDYLKSLIEKSEIFEQELKRILL